MDTQIIITGQDLTELSDCDDAIQDLVRLDGVEQVAISFKLPYKDVFDAFRSHIESWNGVTVKREEKDGVVILRLVWDKESRAAVSAGARALSGKLITEEKQPPPCLMPKK